jgi:hypothetical protein
MAINTAVRNYIEFFLKELVLASILNSADIFIKKSLQKNCKTSTILNESVILYFSEKNPWKYEYYSINFYVEAHIFRMPSGAVASKKLKIWP